MSHLYPIAISAKAALDAPEHAALSRAEAERLAEDQKIVGLETEWLTIRAEEDGTTKAITETGAGAGFVQYYENAAGETVLAVTYWRLFDPSAPVEAPEPIARETEIETDAPPTDHTDDLYFRMGRTKKRGNRKKHDPNQMDLFGGKQAE